MVFGSQLPPPLAPAGPGAQEEGQGQEGGQDQKGAVRGDRGGATLGPGAEIAGAVQQPGAGEGSHHQEEEAREGLSCYLFSIFSRQTFTKPVTVSLIGHQFFVSNKRLHIEQAANFLLL